MSGFLALLITLGATPDEAAAIIRRSRIDPRELDLFQPDALVGLACELIGGYRSILEGMKPL